MLGEAAKKNATRPPNLVPAPATEEQPFRKVMPLQSSRENWNLFFNKMEALTYSAREWLNANNMWGLVVFWPSKRNARQTVVHHLSHRQKTSQKLQFLLKSKNFIISLLLLYIVKLHFHNEVCIKLKKLNKLAESGLPAKGITSPSH